MATALYSGVIDRVVPVSSTRVAEMAKLLENIHRAVNIGLVNETAIISDRLGVDVWEVIDAAATKPFGFMKFTPGPGLGGHCIPAKQEQAEPEIDELGAGVTKGVFNDHVARQPGPGTDDGRWH